MLGFTGKCPFLNLTGDEKVCCNRRKRARAGFDDLPPPRPPFAKTPKNRSRNGQLTVKFVGANYCYTMTNKSIPRPAKTSPKPYRQFFAAKSLGIRHIPSSAHPKMTEKPPRPSRPDEAGGEPSFK